MSHIQPRSDVAIDSSRLRPRRVWYAVAGLCAAVGVVAGMTAFVLTITNVPQITRFSDGESVTVSMATDEAQTIYLHGDSGGRYPSADPECVVVAVDGAHQAVVEPYTGTTTFSSGRDSWLAMFDVTVPRNGDYTVSCREATGQPGTYGIGRKLDVGNLIGGIGAIILLPAVGIVAGGLIVLLVAVGRSRHRTRLMREHRPGQW